LIVGDRLAVSLGRLDAVLVTVNEPCRKGAACGTLADVAKTLNTIRGTAGQIEIAAKHENAQLSTLDRQEAQIYAGVKRSLNGVDSELMEARQLTASMTETSRQASLTLQGAQVDLRTMNTTIAAAQPVLAATTGAVNGVNASVAELTPRMHTFLVQSAKTVANVQGVTADGQRIADKMTADYFAPKPWWKKAAGKFGDAWDITAAVARHLP